MPIAAASCEQNLDILCMYRSFLCPSTCLHPPSSLKPQHAFPLLPAHAAPTRQRLLPHATSDLHIPPHGQSQPQTAASSCFALSFAPSPVLGTEAAPEPGRCSPGTGTVAGPVKWLLRPVQHLYERHGRCMAGLPALDFCMVRTHAPTLSSTGNMHRHARRRTSPLSAATGLLPSDPS